MTKADEELKMQVLNGLTVCGWCGIKIGEFESDENQISHGMCQECRDREFGGWRWTGEAKEAKLDGSH